MSIPLRALIVEDSEDDALQVLRRLKRGGYAVTHERVETAGAMRAALERQAWDIVISDFNMPAFNGRAALALLRQHDPDLPFILVSGTIGEEVAVEAMKAGAHDYVMKNNLARLVPAVKRELNEAGIRAEHRQAQRALAESEKLLRRAQNMAKLAHVISGPDGSFETWSDTLPQLIGVSAAQMPGSTREWSGLLHPEDRALFRATSIEAGRRGTRMDVEYRLRRADGAWVHIRQVMEPLQEGTDEERGTRWFNTLQDVTGEEQAALALHASEERYRSTFEQAAVGIVHSSLDGEILMVNQTFSKMTGYTRAEAIQLHIRDLTHPEDIEGSVKRRLQMLSGTGAPSQGELRLVRKDRSHLWTNVTNSLVRTPDGQPQYFISVFDDISALKHTEADLQRFRAAVDVSADAIMVTDRSSMRYVIVNDAASRMFGYSREELLAMSPHDLMQLPRERLERIYDELIGGGQSAGMSENINRRKDGSLVPVEIFRRALPTESGYLVVASVRDITDRKQAAAAQARLIGILDATPDFVAMGDMDRCVRYRNPAAREFLGMGRDEDSSHASISGSHPEWAAKMIADVGIPTAIREGSWSGDTAMLDRNGHEVPMSQTIIAHKNSGGTVEYLSTIAHNIAARKRAEQIRELEHAVALHLADAETASAGLQAVMRLICKSEGCAVGRYWQADEAAGILRFGECWGTPDLAIKRFMEESRGVVFAPGQGLAGIVWQSGEPLWVRDASNDPRVAKAALARDTGIRGAFVFPVTSEGRTVGVISISSSQLRQPDDRLLAAVRVIGAQVGQFLRRKQGEQKIVRLTRVYAVLSGINGAIVRIRDQQELFQEVCRIAIEVGHFVMAWIGFVDREAGVVKPVTSCGDVRNFFESAPLAIIENRPGGQELAGRAIRDMKPVVSNDVANDPQSLMKTELADRKINSVAVIPLIESGKAVGVFALYASDTGFFDEEEMELLVELADDISFGIQHIQQEEKVRRLTRVHEVLSGINGAIVRLNDRQQLCEEACRIAVEKGGFVLAWIGLLDQDQQAVIPCAAAGDERHMPPKFRLSTRTDQAEGQGPVGIVIRSGTPFISNNMESDGRLAANPQNIGQAARSMVMLPLQLGGKMIGVMEIDARIPDFFDESEMKLLNELAGDISFALDHLAKSEKVEYLAYYDPLTDLPNRSLFHERLTQFVNTASREQRKLGVVLWDVDRFRTINDTLGRQAGDALLQQIAERMRRAERKSGLPARIGADHFVVVVPEMQTAEELARRVEAATIEFFGTPFVVGDTELRISAKAGIALFPENGADADTLLRNAEAALDKAKATGEPYVFYEQKMTERVAEKLALENKLRQALEKEEFVLHYQPKVDLENRSIVGVEALIRWQSPELGLVPPLKFISLLEETGLILQVGSWALTRAARDHREWTQQGLKPPRVAVNVSPIQLRQRDFVKVVEEAIIGGVAPTGIDLEITESLIMEDIQGNIEKLKSVGGLGVKIAIDDFGTGYSSLAYLAKLPVQTLKIDRAFINTMLDDPDSATLVHTMISLAHSLRLKVVAEGVETEEQAKMLRLQRCDEMQGYLFSKPLPMEQMTTLLLKTKTARPA